MKAGPAPLLQAPRALLLDAMGTLIGLRQSVGRTYAALAAAHGIAVEAEAIDEVFPSLYRQAPPLAFPGVAGQKLLEAERGWWGERIAEALRAAGAAAPPIALQRELFEHFAEPAPWRRYDDVLPLLRRWREAGLRLAVVSNFDQRLHRLLEGLELADLIDVVVVSSAAGAAKPSPLPFQLALEALGVPPDRAWHVGDSPEDVRGAAAAGVTCLRIRRP